MQLEVNGTRLWFDVDGPALVPDGSTMRERPTVVLVHGGPGGFDHTYFKPDFTALTPHAQVVYLDLRDHGRSERHDPTELVRRLDPVTPVDASHEIVDALPDGIGRLEVIAGAGHFPWLYAPEAYWPVIEEFVATATNG